jgi:hypothetical protein
MQNKNKVELKSALLDITEKNKFKIKVARL